MKLIPWLDFDVFEDEEGEFWVETAVSVDLPEGNSEDVGEAGAGVSVVWAVFP